MGARMGLPFALLLLLICSVSFPPSSSIVVNAAAVSTSSSRADDESGSVLQALLESQYSEWMELVERAQMLHPLEQLVGSGDKLTIFAPLNHQMHPDIKAFLLKPPNAHLLKKLVQFHVLPQRVEVSQWRDATMMSLAGDSVTLTSVNELGSIPSEDNVKLYVGEAEIVAPEIIVRTDGIVHGVDQMMLPMSVQQAYVAFTTRHLATPLPTGAPALDTRRIILAGEGGQVTTAAKIMKEKLSASAPAAPVSPVAAPSPFLAPAPGPSLGPSASPYFDGIGSFGDKEVTTFVMALSRFGGYSEFAGLLVDMTSMGYEISKLVNKGYKLTILAPDDTAWKEANLTPEQLNSPAELEQVLRYHIITEYQTEESLYSTFRRNGKTFFNTLHDTLKLSGHELDGLVVFGEGETQAGVFDHDIFADGSVSVQGVDKVIFAPTEAETTKPTEANHQRSVLEMLQLPSRKSVVGNSGPRGTVATAASFAAVASFVVLLVINVLL